MSAPSFGPGRGYLEGEDPSFSPDGREVAFNKDHEIWISGVDGRSLRRVTEGSNPAWAPDGSRIAFTFERDIWVVGPDGSNRARLTTDPGIDREPAWSPDGASIAFTSNRTGRSEIWIMRSDGTDPRRVTNEPGFRSASSASFSPDGRRIVFRGNRGSTPLVERRSKLMIIDSDGGRLCQLTYGEFEDQDPTWSTRGIAFHSYRHPPDGQVWVVLPDASGPTQLPGTYGSDPAWSPDGTKLAYSDGRRIEVYNLLDGTVRQLTQFNVVTLQIYVRPGLTNAIDPKTDRSIPVAILSAPWFDPVGRIDQASIRFGPAGKERPPASCAPADVNKDSTLDLVCEFNAVDAFPSGETEAVLKATGIDGIPFEGRDTVRVVPAR